jgi:polysaccharide export outer membrane protein
MRSNLKKVFFLAVILFNMSCTAYKNIPYFQDLDHKTITQENIDNYSPLKIQPGDLLGINVSSTSTAEALAPFISNSNRVTGNNNDGANNRSNTPQGLDNANTNPVFGYRVSPKGEIEMPLVGTVKAAGLTTDELTKKLTPQVEQYVKKPVLSIRILNFKISVLGDVLRPDVFSVQNERITIIEALGLAGDLNITAKRKNVLLIREYEGKREYLPIDLTSKKLFSSPYYYLQNNDVIYVEPDRTKYAPLDRGYRTLTLLISAVSVASVLVTAYVLYYNGN